MNHRPTGAEMLYTTLDHEHLSSLSLSLSLSLSRKVNVIIPRYSICLSAGAQYNNLPFYSVISREDCLPIFITIDSSLPNQRL